VEILRGKNHLEQDTIVKLVRGEIIQPVVWLVGIGDNMEEEWKNILKIDDEIEKFRKPITFDGINFKNQQAVDLYSNYKQVMRNENAEGFRKDILMMNRRDPKITTTHVERVFTYREEQKKKIAQRAHQLKQQEAEEAKRVQAEKERLSEIERVRRVSRSKPTNEEEFARLAALEGARKY